MSEEIKDVTPAPEVLKTKELENDYAQKCYVYADLQMTLERMEGQKSKLEKEVDVARQTAKSALSKLIQHKEKRTMTTTVVQEAQQ